MAPSTEVKRRTSKQDLAKRLNEIAKEGLESHDKEVLREYYFDIETTRKETLRTLSQAPVWMTVPHVPGMVPCLVFLYGGRFAFEGGTGTWTEHSLEIYDYPPSFPRICLAGAARVLVIYQASKSGAQDSGVGVR